MPKQIVSDVFENIVSVAKSAGQQIDDSAKKMTEEAAIELGLKPQTQGATDDAQKQDQAKEEEINKMKATEHQKTASNYKKITEEIRQIQLKKKQEIPKEVSGKPGFDEGKAIKQIETGKPEEDKKKLPPINVQRERTKAERFRGASG